ALSSSARDMPIMSFVLSGFMAGKLRMLFQNVLFAAKTMHQQRPQQSDDSSFHRRQQSKGREHGKRHPDRQMLPHAERRDRLDPHESPDHHMADNQDHQIGRQIVGPMMVQGLVTMRTMVPDLGKGAESAADPAC